MVHSPLNIHRPFDYQVDKPWVKGAAVQMKYQFTIQICEPIIYLLKLRPFWEAKNGQYPTWNPSTEESAMQIDYIRVYAWNN